MAVKQLPPGSDPANPPLANGEEEKAALLTNELVRKYGEPAAIFTSPMTRCLQSARPAIEWFGQHQLPGSVLVVTLNTLCQPDSGDVDPANPKARADGLVIYGPESFSPEWYEWFKTSRRIIRAIDEQVIMTPGQISDRRPIFVFTHRPLVAAARWVAQHGDVVPGKNDINALEGSLLPFCLFEERRLPGYMITNWTELPRE
ncbi:histidine phosphatase family protein [Candidatus Uhrbacteria bacterium]|nr:histidine phosphatase family protein [Candidatus Uhrbacteria bacterium]